MDNQDVDCAPTKKTGCSIPVGATRTNPRFDYEGDAEWFATTLKAKKTYQATVGGDAVATAGCVGLDVYDAKSKRIPPTAVKILPDNSVMVTFKAATAGTAFIAPSYSCEQGPIYFSLKLTGG